MKAAIFETYGGPDVIQIVETEKPVPAEGQVLIKVHASSANPLDWHRMRGEPAIVVRPSMGFNGPRNPKLGADIAGVVEAVGDTVTEFKAGDAVFGENSDSGFGAFAEYALAPAQNLTHKPANISFEEAGSVSVTGLTAIQGLRDEAKIQPGQRVLINGASGGVGTFAVQYAKSLGCIVTGVCSTRNLELICSIGADHAIDYTQQDFTQTGEQYDLIFDCVGNRSVKDLRRALVPSGTCVVTGFTHMGRLLRTMLAGRFASLTSAQTIKQAGTAQPHKLDLELIRDLLAEETVTVVIDRHYPLGQTSEAVGYVEQGHARGKVVIKVA